MKHEAWALRRQRERHSPVTDDGELRDRPAPTAVTHEQAERLRAPSPSAPRRSGSSSRHEVRALRLKAEGFSYREICAMTGWSYTKVNRLLTEGRQAFLRRVSGIERGAECARYEPLLSALADGEASAEQLATLRPHMRTCLSCRAAPARVPGRARAGGRARAAGRARGRRTAAARCGAWSSRSSGASERFHAAAELATGQKIAAVAASAAALAGGGTAIDEFANHQGPPLPEPVQQVEAAAGEGRDRGGAGPSACRGAARRGRARPGARTAAGSGARAAAARSGSRVRTRRRHSRAGPDSAGSATTAGEQLRPGAAAAQRGGSRRAAAARVVSCRGAPRLSTSPRAGRSARPTADGAGTLSTRSDTSVRSWRLNSGTTGAASAIRRWTPSHRAFAAVGSELCSASARFIWASISGSHQRAKSSLSCDGGPNGAHLKIGWMKPEGARWSVNQPTRPHVDGRVRRDGVEVGLRRRKRRNEVRQPSRRSSDEK